MLRRLIAAAGLGTALVALASQPTVLAAGTLRWSAPLTITSGVPAHVASIDPCPPVPTPGDSTLVQITVLFPTGGGMGQVFPANADGSWSSDVTFTFVGAPPVGTISAECDDFTGHSATPYAEYQTDPVVLVP
jgi:hypothetical protein